MAGDMQPVLQENRVCVYSDRFYGDVGVGVGERFQ